MKKIFTLILLSILAGMFSQAYAQDNYVPSESNLKHRAEFEDMRFGVFIHWGIYSMSVRESGT